MVSILDLKGGVKVNRFFNFCRLKLSKYIGYQKLHSCHRPLLLLIFNMLDSLFYKNWKQVCWTREKANEDPASD